MIRGDDVDPLVADGLTQGFSVSHSLDGGVPLDAVAVGGIIGVGEPEVMHAGLGRDPLLCQRELIAE